MSSRAADDRRMVNEQPRYGEIDESSGVTETTAQAGLRDDRAIETLWEAMVAAVREFGVDVEEDDLRIALAPQWAAGAERLEALVREREGQVEFERDYFEDALRTIGGEWPFPFNAQAYARTQLEEGKRAR